MSKTNAVSIPSGTPRNEREALFQQTIKDLKERNQTLSAKCREWEDAAMKLVRRVNVAESERDCARQELEKLRNWKPTAYNCP